MIHLIPEKELIIEMYGADSAEPSYDATQYSVHIQDYEGEIVMWTGDEWIEDPTVVASIVNALMMAVTKGPRALRESIA